MMADTISLAWRKFNALQNNFLFFQRNFLIRLLSSELPFSLNRLRVLYGSSPGETGSFLPEKVTSILPEIEWEQGAAHHPQKVVSVFLFFQVFLLWQVFSVRMFLAECHL